MYILFSNLWLNHIVHLIMLPVERRSQKERIMRKIDEEFYPDLVTEGQDVHIKESYLSLIKEIIRLSFLTNFF